MKTEKQIKERIEEAKKEAENSYKYGDFRAVDFWYDYAAGLEWVLEEECQK